MQPNDIINDRYLLLRSIGRGSFGEVWLATDQKLGMNVAIKIYIALDPRGLNEFKTEFKSAYNLHHQNLLRADYFDNIGNKPYLVMQYCPCSVGDKVGKMDEAEIWNFIKGVAGGLTYLHSNDIIHRDIKPDNILKDEQGNYVITDFGLSTKMRSTLRKASARLNDSTKQSGTIGYMAPEMFSSKPNAVKATDIWALGATIYEIATGEMPFCGQGGVMELYGAELPELPSNYGATLSDLMQRCLAKNAWNRPTAKEINEIAHSVCPDSKEDIYNRAVLTIATQERYKQEILELKEKLASVKRGGDSSDYNYIQKKKRFFKISFWLTFGLLVISILLGLSCIRMLSNKYDSKLFDTEFQLHEANAVISNIEEICKNGSSEDNIKFSNWTSSNHSHNSRDFKEYTFNGYQGDVLKFDYGVDSESYDHFRAFIKHDGNTITLKDISGLNKNGSVTYKLPDNGIYILVMEYKKDHSVHSGNDNVRVYNIELHRSSLGEIAREITSYNELRALQSGDSIQSVDEVAVAPTEDWSEYSVDEAK